MVGLLSSICFNGLKHFMSVVSDVQAIFKPPNAMRGGIQMCFPQVLQYAPFFSWFSIGLHVSAVILNLSTTYKFICKTTNREGSYLSSSLRF